MNNTIFITGPSASGKSTLSRRLAHDIGYSWLDTGSIIRMTALVMEENNIHLPDSNEAALETPTPPWEIGEINQSSEIPLYIDGQLLDYDDARLRNPAYDTNTLFLARALRPRTWELLHTIAEREQTVISSRRVPTDMLEDPKVLPIYLDLDAKSRLTRRARFEGIQVDPEITQRIVDKEKENVEIGNLISPGEALHKRYVMVSNTGNIDESARQLLFEVIRTYTDFSSENDEEVLRSLQTISPGLKHFTRWDELIRILRSGIHHEGIILGKEY